MGITCVNARVRKHREALKDEAWADVDGWNEGGAGGRIEAQALGEVERCLAVFLGIAK